MEKHDLGRAGEEFACTYLRKKGYHIIERNYRVGHLETDIICENKEELVFVEVKSRSDIGFPSDYGPPSAAVNAQKQRHLLLCARQYLYRFPTEKQPRLDVIEVYLVKRGGRFVLSSQGINHIENAFSG